MDGRNASTELQVRTGLDYASGSADRNGAIFDSAGFEGVMVCWKFGAIAPGAVTTVKVQQDTDPAGGTMADLSGTGIAVAADDDDQIFIQDIYKPTERYLRGVIDKDAANATAEVMWYIGYGAREAPVTLTLADEVTYERHISPAEGTA